MEVFITCMTSLLMINLILERAKNQLNDQEVEEIRPKHLVVFQGSSENCIYTRNVL